MLIIDDDMLTLQTMESALEPQGVECVCFQDPLQALEFDQTWRCSAAIVDYKMPQKNGLEVLKNIKDRDPGVVVFIITGYPDAALKPLAERFGAEAVYYKPLNIREFLHRLKECVKENN